MLIIVPSHQPTFQDGRCIAGYQQLILAKLNRAEAMKRY